MKKVEKSFNDIAKKVKTSMHEINIVKEMIKDIIKYFNKKFFFLTNQQVIGLREFLRGVAVKSWVALPLERIKFKKHNTFLIKISADFCSECWRERYSVIHSPECRKNP